MGKRTTTAGQLALPMAQDEALAHLSGGETRRTAANAVKDVRAADLLSAVTGLSFAQAEEVLKRAGGIHKLAQLPDYALQGLPHVGAKRAKQIRALTDWNLLLRSPDEWQMVQVRNPTDVADLLMLEMSLLEQEHLRTVLLDTKSQVTHTPTIYAGNVNSVIVRISEVFREAIRANSTSIILAHNHPSGDPTPSPEDVRITEMIVEAGRLLDIDVLDHLIIGRNRFVSLKERGLGFG